MIIAIVLAVLTALALTILLCIKVLPAKYDGKFSKNALQKVHDYFNFKKLYLESVLKYLFTFLTWLCVLGGFFMATVGNFFEVIANILRFNEYYHYYADNAFEYLDQLFELIWPTMLGYFFGGLLIAVLGPIVLRLAYEGVLMSILLVKNVIDINNKLKPSEEKQSEEKPEEKQPEESEN